MSDFQMSIVASILGGGFFNWLFREWISERIKNSIANEYAQKLETHKSSLKSLADVELEKLRSQLAQASIEHQVKFSKLHELRAEIIANTYERLKDLYMKLGDYVKLFEPVGDKSQKERRELAAQAHKFFNDYFQGKLIFFPKTTADKLQEINLDLVRAFNQFAINVEMAGHNRQNSTENWIKVFETVNVEIKEALVEIECEFRALLGEQV